MRRLFFPKAVMLIAVCAMTGYGQDKAEGPAGSNRIAQQSKQGACNFDEFARAVTEVQKRRQGRLIDAKQFAKMAQEPGILILDARSELSFELLHIKIA